MKEFFLRLFFFCVLALPATVMARAIQVVTTTTDLAAIAQEIGGDKVAVKSLCQGTDDPHFLEPKPSYIVAVNRADLLIEVGLQLETGWLPVLITQSRNPKIQKDLPGRLLAAENVRVLELPAGPIDRSQGDVHPEGNPHYWLDPNNGLIIAREVSEHLAKIDPDNAEYYAKRYQLFHNRLQKKMAQWQTEAASFRGKKVVAYHKTYSYLASWLGLEVVDYIEPKPGVPPSPTHVLSLLQRLEKDKITTILTSPYYDMTATREIAKKAKAQVLIIPSSVGGEDGIHTYTDLFDNIITKLKGGV